jgi:hypothetical protein
MLPRNIPYWSSQWFLDDVMAAAKTLVDQFWRAEYCFATLHMLFATVSFFGPGSAVRSHWYRSTTACCNCCAIDQCRGVEGGDLGQHVALKTCCNNPWRVALCQLHPATVYRFQFHSFRCTVYSLQFGPIFCNNIVPGSNLCFCCQVLW